MNAQWEVSRADHQEESMLAKSLLERFVGRITRRGVFDGASAARIAMTEEQWLECSDPDKMLSFLRGKASDRKLRLFAVACCRRIWHLLSDERSRQAVEAGERYADGLIRERELRAIAAAAHQVDTDGFNNAADAAYLAAEINSPPNHPDAEWGIASETMSGALFADPRHIETKSTDLGLRYYPTACIKEAHCRLLRDIFNNPFRPVSVRRTWRTTEAVALARSMYDRRSFDHMTDLADLLEVSGCTDSAILEHCRALVGHVRGCWVVDLILGKY
jgi:hypothetical protein